MARLRAPGGCPWDREQTFDTIKPYTLEETYEVLDAIDRARLARTGRRAGRPAAAGRLLFADGRRAESVHHRRRARRHQRKADPPPSARLRRRIGRDRRRREAHLGRGEGRREKPRKAGRARGRPAGLACRARCRRWWRRSRSPRAPRTWASIGRMPSRCSTSCTKSWPNSSRGAPRPASPRGAGRRAGRPAVRAGEPGALRQGRSRAGAAQDQRQVPPRASATSNASWPSAARSRPMPASRKWRRCGRKPSDDRDPRALTEARRIPGRRRACRKTIWGFDRRRPAADAAVRGGARPRWAARYSAPTTAAA